MKIQLHLSPPPPSRCVVPPSLFKKTSFVVDGVFVDGLVDFNGLLFVFPSSRFSREAVQRG